mgnify:FL=1
MSLTQINKAGLDEIALDHVFTIGALGNASAYTFQGEGLNGTVNNPTLYLTRGKTYRFENGSGGHPIRIQSTSGANGTAYNTGVTNNAQAGTVIVEVQHDAPDILYYQCTSHAAMNGILYIVGAVSDGSITANKLASGSVTTAKIADSTGATDGVTEAKIASLAVTTNKINTGAVVEAKLATGAVTETKIGNSQVTTSKIAADAVTDAKLADHASDDSLRAVGTNHIKTDAVTADKLAHTGVTAATYGTAALIPAITVDAQGRITAATANSIAVGGINGVIYNDDVKARFGSGGDFEILHRSSDDSSIIKNSNNTNFLRILAGDTSSGGTIIKNANDDVTYLRCRNHDGVELFHSNSKKFDTTSGGIAVTGDITSTGSVSDSKGDLRKIPADSKSSAYTLQATDAGKLIYISSGGVTVPIQAFVVGQAVSIINNSGSDQTITQGTSMTLYNTADATTGNRTLAGRGMATIWFADHNIAYISGAGLS